MKRYSDLMKNGSVKCSISSCSYCYSGKCCYFSSANEDIKKNDVCTGKIPSATSAPMQIGFFRTDFSDVDTDTLRSYERMFDELESCLDTSSPNVTDVWKVLSRMKVLVRQEIALRKSKALEREKVREKKRKKGIPVPKTHRKPIKPIKAKR